MIDWLIDWWQTPCQGFVSPIEIGHSRMTKFSAITVAWENRWHFTMPPTVSPWNEVWETSAEIPYWWCVTTQWGSALDWLKQISQVAQPIRSSTRIWVVTRHQYGISALVSQTSFHGEIVGGIAKCHLFSLTTIPDKNTRLIVNVSQETAVINRKSKNNLPESVFSHNYQPLRQKRHQIVVNNLILLLSIFLIGS